MHNDFTLFLRKYPNGKKVFFYYAYDEKGIRRGPWTTKTLNRTEATKFCNRLFKEGALLVCKNKVLTFGEFAEGFWERGSEYIKNQESRMDITDNYLNTNRSVLVHQILPFFAHVPLKMMNEKDINKWLIGFKNREVIKNGKTEIKQYKNTYANTVYSVLNIMLDEAVRQDLIQKNPCDKVKRLRDDTKNIVILTVEEVQKIFPQDYQSVWGNREESYIANRLASLTGMRAGEILGLKGEYIFDNYIYVCGQYTDKGYQNHTKTKENRKIPLLPEVMIILRDLAKENGKGFLFSLDGGAKPVSTTYLNKELKRALMKIGVSKEEIKRRNLSMHGWRHFVNTDLLRQGMTIQQVQTVTGHKSIRNTDRYSHLEPSLIQDIVKAQENITGGKKKKAKPDGAGEERKLVKKDKPQ
jgi:integrase